ncbi:NADPH-dependent FMN reductase [Thiomicrorhabdus sediminis]|uniref:NAD(P)H-dependent oxidoreductase n=1 Tax=Thiomicrorhabdus sediminis TaxID=2580412 RepID=A0A4P9K301_9GAMM|nr:NAD(P)H-dependent oxidoreductase [Thiomicrorhabdus sediminis]QCU89195.1 NAD(P)H-dependent oxidoreductase [Thiomicrorhabdus sediminis]
MKIVAFSGSLRANSINSGLLRSLQAIGAYNVQIEIIDYSDVPLYNQDVNDAGMHESVELIGDKISAADAVIIAVPEYNYSFPGVLKNLLDWLSRVESKPFDNKPLALLGASPAMNGTVRAQMHLRQVLVYLNARMLNKPELSINQSNHKFDSQGNLIDKDSLRYLDRFLQALIQFTDN